MKFFWKDLWVPKDDFDSSRRGFLIGATATALLAPAVVHSGILMPVRKLLLPEPPKVLLKSVATTLEGSFDNKNWFPVARVVAPKDVRLTLSPENFPFDTVHEQVPSFYRQIITEHWALHVDIPFERMEKLYKQPRHQIGSVV